MPSKPASHIKTLMDEYCFGDLDDADNLQISPLGVDTTLLVQALAAGSCVVWVGAGASIAAGLPGWSELLEKLLTDINPLLADPNEKNWAHGLLQRGEFLALAEFLQHQIDKKRLESLIWDTFVKVRDPTDIHREIARLPFSLAITTNYEKLLEASYSSAPTVKTWRDPIALLSTIQDGRFTIIKAHGDLGNGESLVLTRTQYRDLIRRNNDFNTCLKLIFRTKTVLFVGSSLQDPDLQGLLDELVVEFGNNFGPHFAILPESNAPHSYRQILKKAFSIQPLTYKVARCDNKRTENIKNEIDKQELKAWDSKNYVKGVVKWLKYLGGRAATTRCKLAPSVVATDVLFNQQTALQKILENAVSVSGAFRGDIAIRHQELEDLLDNPQEKGLWVIATEGPTSPDCDPLVAQQKGTYGVEVQCHSVIWNAFHLTEDDGALEVPNVDEIANEKSYYSLHYRSAHTEVKSQFAVPLISGNRRAGVLNLEFRTAHAWTNDHIEVAKGYAAEAGLVITSCEHRKQAVQEAVAETPAFASELIQHLKPALAQPNLIGGLLYVPQYRRGLLACYYLSTIGSIPTPSLKPEWSFDFDSIAFATHAFKQGRMVFEPDVANSKLPIDRQRFKDVGAEGNWLFALPVLQEGHCATVLVLYPTSNKVSFTHKEQSLVKATCELVRARRAARMHKNKIHQALDLATRGLSTRRQYSELLNLVEFKHIRIWKGNDISGPGRLKLIGHFRNEGGRIIDARARTIGRIKKSRALREECLIGDELFVPEDYAPLRYLVKRSGKRRGVQRMHAEMFVGQATDPKMHEFRAAIEKVDAEPWMAAPIYRKRERDPAGVGLEEDELIGCWVFDGPQLQTDSAQQFQRVLLDFIVEYIGWNHKSDLHDA